MAGALETPSLAFAVNAIDENHLDSILSFLSTGRWCCQMVRRYYIEVMDLPCMDTTIASELFGCALIEYYGQEVAALSSDFPGETLLKARLSLINRSCEGVF